MASNSNFDARDMKWVDELPEKWEMIRAFRRRSQEGRSLARGLHQPGHGDNEVVTASLDCAKLNSELLLITLKLMADHACIFVPPVYLLQGACLEFHSNCGFPDASALADMTIRSLVDEFQRAYVNLETAVGPRLAKLLRERAAETDDPGELATLVDAASENPPIDEGVEVAAGHGEDSDDAGYETSGDEAEASSDDGENSPVDEASGDDGVSLEIDSGDGENPAVDDATGKDVGMAAPVNGDVTPTEPDEDVHQPPLAGPDHEPRPGNASDRLSQQLRLAELKLEAKRLMDMERKHTAKQLQLQLDSEGPIAVSDGEGDLPRDLSGPATTSAAPDFTETQAYAVDTQMLQDVLGGLDQEVPSPGQPLAAGRLPSTAVLPGSVDPACETSPDPKETAASVDPPSEALETPSPKNLAPPEISPVKTCITRDSQLRAKSTKVAENAEKPGRGRGAGRGRGRGGGRPKKDAEPEPVAETSKPKKGGRPKKNPVAESSKPKVGRPKKNPVAEPVDESAKPKGGRPKKPVTETVEEAGGGLEKVPDIPLDVVTKGKKLRRKKVSKRRRAIHDDAAVVEKDIKEAKIGGTTDGPVLDIPKAKKAKSVDPSKAELVAPTTRCTGKRKVAETTPAAKCRPGSGLQIRRSTPKEEQWPNVFARRYRPSKDSWMQRLWDGSVRAFYSIIAPEMAPGQKTRLEACVYILYINELMIFNIGFGLV
ncbi:unnamed protein product [Symbiodinium sp. CCMP2592]|nr:unnamed protein product [Symbiodinium sp. CCMP2592]